jgi:hypothetical protein
MGEKIARADRTLYDRNSDFLDRNAENECATLRLASG